MVEIKTIWDGDTTSYKVIVDGEHVSSHWTYEEAKAEADGYEEDTTMKNVKFELNNATYESNAKGTHFYKTVDNKKTRISKDEFEADYEKMLRDKKVEDDAKTAEEAVAKKTKKRAKKNVAFEHEGITLTEKQVKFLKLLPNDDFFENGLQSTLWIDVLCDTVASEFNPMVVGAMVSTLREKNLIYVAEQRVNGKKCKYFGFTHDGEEIALALGLV